MKHWTLIAVLLLVADVVTKSAARAFLDLCADPATCAPYQAWNGYGLLRMENRGSVLGFEQGLWLWTAIALTSPLVIWFYYRVGIALNGLIAAGSALQLSGAAGNLFDRLLFGGVTDFFLVGDAIVINVADVALLVGALMASLGFVIAALRPLPAKQMADAPPNA